MGQEQSKAGHPDAQQRDAQFLTAGKKSDESRDDGQIPGSRSSTAPIQSDQVPIAAALPNSGPKIHIPMKRSRDERERGDERSHGSRTPLESERASTIDSYRPRPRPDSPRNTRDAFVRERDHWSPRRGRRTPSASPPPPPSRRQSSIDNMRQPSLLKSSPALNHEQHDSSQRDSSLYRNLTWKAPAPQQRQVPDPLLNTAQSYGNSTARSPSDGGGQLGPNFVAPEKRDYEGLKGVPTGPKQPNSYGGLRPLDAEVSESAANRRAGPSTQPTRDHEGVKAVPTGPKQSPYRGALRLPDVEVKLQPHIFISGRHLPPLEATRKHLAQFLIRYDVNVEDVFVDGQGYYIVFENTDAGRERLEACYNHKHKTNLFHQYPLEMKCFFSGQANTRTPLHPDGNAANSSPIRMGTANSATVLEIASKAGLSSDGTNIPFPLDKISEYQDVADPRLQGRVSDSIPLSSTKPLPTADSVDRSSPLRVPSRQEKDDSSSVSGLTGSDISGPTRTNCHVCKNSSQFEIEQLTLCSSCPRRYHSRCHKIPIPSDLVLEHSWQCHRCIRRQVQPKSRLSAESLHKEISPTSPIDQPTEPAPKRSRLDYSQSSPVDQPVSGKTSSGAISGNGLIKDHVNHHRRSNGAIYSPGVGVGIDTAASEKPLVNSDDRHFHEADELVEQSFAASQGPKQVTGNLAGKSGGPTLFRRKLTDPPHSMSVSPGNWLGEQAEKLVDEHNESPQPAELDDEQTRKKKSHKWAGGGADKDIIQSGMNGLSRLSPEVGASSTVDKPGAHPTNELQQKDASPATGPILQRKRPGNPAVVPCSRCGRKIASNPSGTNKYCTRCKKDMSTNSASDLTKEKLVQDAQGGRKTPEPVNDDRSGSANGPASRTLPELPTATDQSNATDRPTSSRSLRQPQSRDACEGCKCNQEQCTHIVPAPQTSLIEEEDSKVLDFWTVKETPKKNRVASNEITTQGEANGDVDVDVDVDDGSTSDLSELEDMNGPAGSPLPSDGNPVTPVKSQGRNGKTVSHTSITMDMKGLGNSFERPKNTYKKLISMALCDAPGHRLRTTAIVQWVAKNIPGYNIGQGHGWEKNLQAIVSFNCIGSPQCRQPLWKKIPLDANAKKTAGHFYELLPGLDENLLHWDPAIQEPVTPPKSWRLQLLPSTDDDSSHGIDETSLTGGNGLHPQPLISSTAFSTNGGTSTELSRSGRSTRNTGHRHKRMSADQMDNDVADKFRSTNAATVERDESMRSEEAVNSSDDEPIARKKRTSKALDTSFQQSPMEREDDDVVEVMDIDGSNHEAWVAGSIKPTVSVRQPRQHIRPAPLPASQEFALLQSIKRETGNIDYSAKSLFDEHPEYDPSNPAFDREAKIAEIRRRPNRKRRIGAKSVDPWFEAKYTKSLRSANPSLSGRSSLSSERMVKTAVPNVYPWESGEGNVKHFDTLQEFFDLPNNPIAILHDGQLAFRDGTRNEDGTLPRAKVVYKTGYA